MIWLYENNTGIILNKLKTKEIIESNINETNSSNKSLEEINNKNLNIEENNAINIKIPKK